MFWKQTEQFCHLENQIFLFGVVSSGTYRNIDTAVSRHRAKVKIDLPWDFVI